MSELFSAGTLDAVLVCSSTTTDVELVSSAVCEVVVSELKLLLAILKLVLVVLSNVVTFHVDARSFPTSRQMVYSDA